MPMKQRVIGGFWLAIIWLTSGLTFALPHEVITSNPNLPIVVVIADKLNSDELWQTELPAVKKLLASSACGLLNIRSGAGYTDTASGYLSLGAGGRNTVPKELLGTHHPADPLPGGTAASYLKWDLRSALYQAPNLILPDMSLLSKATQDENFLSYPGSLGKVFREHGWSTYLIGNLDVTLPFHPGGYLIADQDGLITGGSIDPSINEPDWLYPNQTRFSVARSMTAIGQHLTKQNLIVIDFGDFYRLDYYHTQMAPEQFAALKEAAWANFGHFLEAVLVLQAKQPFSIVLLSPSVSSASKERGNLLAPLIINDPNYPPGLLWSGTTKWDGLVANLDFLPTLVQMRNFNSPDRFPGRIIKSQPRSDHLLRLAALNERLSLVNIRQRQLLDWYMGLISCGWILGVLSLLFRKKWMGNFPLTFVLAIPLAFIILPVFPEGVWRVPFWLALTLSLSLLASLIKDTKLRLLSLAALTWGFLILDQVTGWQLIRFSALGYNAMAGSRYYGMGNEYMGIFVAAALITAHFTLAYTKRNWLAFAVLGLSMGVLAHPWYGAKFGGILAGASGFTYYLIRLFHLKFNRRSIMLISSFGLFLLLVGFWDSIRPPDVQTHIGRFIKLLWTGEFGQVVQILTRKIGMNLKLTLESAWMRIVLLALGLAIIHRLIAKRRLVNHHLELWKAILISGFTAYLVNDAGVLAFATCLALGFTFILITAVNTISERSPVPKENLRQD